MTRILAGLAAAAFLLVAASCDSDPTRVDPRDITFAPELGIDLDAMTRKASGLYVHDVQVGEPPTAMPGREVSVLYQGWLPDGTLFDSATDPAAPVAFRLGFGQVIMGWEEGIPGMRVGGIRKLVIPPSLGYGDRAVGPIPPNSVLVFEVHVVGVRDVQ